MRRAIAISSVLFALASWTLAASPPARVNYQGSLRTNPGGVPENGNRDMIFHFFDMAAGGCEILRDIHTGAASVTVTGGLFNVLLGSGSLSNPAVCPPNAPHTSLDQVFRDFSDVYLEVEVGPVGGALETLSPRTQIVSAAYSLNADHLDGKNSGEFAVLAEANNFTNPANSFTGNGTGLTGVNAATLGSLSFSDFLRSNLSTTYAGIGSTLTFADGTTLALDTTGGGVITKFTEGSIDRSGTGAQTFRIKNTLGGLIRLEVDGNVWAGDTDQVPPGAVNYNRFALGGTDPRASGDIALRNDIYTDGSVEVQGWIYAGGSIIVGDSTPTSLQSFSSFGEAAGKDETNVSSGDDVYIAGDLELDGAFYSPTLTVYRGAFNDAHSDGGLGWDIDADDPTHLTSGNLFEWAHDGTFGGAGKLMDLSEAGNLRIRGTLTQNFVFPDLAESFLKSEKVEPGDLVRVDSRRSNAVRLTVGEDDSSVLGVVSERPGFLLGGAPFDIESLGTGWGQDLKARFLAERGQLREKILAQRGDLRAQLEKLGASPDSKTPPSVSEGTSSHSGAPFDDKNREAMLQFESRLDELALESFHEQNFASVALSGRVPVKVDTRFGDIRTGDLLAPSPLPGVAMKASKPGPIIGTSLESFSGGFGKVLVFVHLGSYTPPTDVQQVQEIASRTPDAKTGTQTLEGNLQIVLDKGADDRSRFSVFRDGQGNLGTEVFRVDEEGNVYARGSFRPASLDLAEYHPVSEPVEVGDVLVVDRTSLGSLRRGDKASDPGVVGIVSGEPGILLGSGILRIAAVDPDVATRLEDARSSGDRREEARLWTELEAKFKLTNASVALSGTVPCKVDASYGSIGVGDLLTVSPTPGHAMRSADKAPGTILGKALEPLDSGTGLIKVLVMLR